MVCARWWFGGSWRARSAGQRGELAVGQMGIERAEGVQCLRGQLGRSHIRIPEAWKAQLRAVAVKTSAVL